jgi:hypothetical protein
MNQFLSAITSSPLLCDRPRAGPRLIPSVVQVATRAGATSSSRAERGGRVISHQRNYGAAARDDHAVDGVSLEMATR